MKGVYMLIMGLCIWFVPGIAYQAIMNPNALLTDESAEVLASLPLEVIMIQFVLAIAVVFKGVITIRKERKTAKVNSRENTKNSKKRSKKK